MSSRSSRPRQAGVISSAALGKGGQDASTAEQPLPPKNGQQLPGGASMGSGAAPRDDDDRINMPKFGLFRFLLGIDLSALLFLQSVRRRLPLCVRSLFDRMISGHPAHDISLVIWIAAAGAIWGIGWPLAWLMLGNATLSFLIAWLLPMVVAPLKLVALVGKIGNLLRGLGSTLELIYRTPESYDPRLKPRPRVSPTGFPCVELHLLTVLWSAVLVSYLDPKAVYNNTGKGASIEPASKVVSTALIVTCAATFGFFLWMRLYAGTHLLWQLVASCVLGGLSVPLELHLANSVWPKGVSTTMHAVSMSLLVFGWLGYVCYQAESNAVPFMRLEREEYLRVMREIASSAANPSSDKVHLAFRYEVTEQQDKDAKEKKEKGKDKAPPKGKVEKEKESSKKSKKSEDEREDNDDKEDEEREARRRRRKETGTSSRSLSRANSETEGEGQRSSSDREGRDGTKTGIPLPRVMHASTSSSGNTSGRSVTVLRRADSPAMPVMGGGAAAALPPLPPAGPRITMDGESVLERPPRRDGFAHLMESLDSQPAIDRQEKLKLIERQRRAAEAAALSSGSGFGSAGSGGSGSETDNSNSLRPRGPPVGPSSSVAAAGTGLGMGMGVGMGRPPAGPNRRSASPPAGRMGAPAMTM